MKDSEHILKVPKPCLTRVSLRLGLWWLPSSHSLRWNAPDQVPWKMDLCWWNGVKWGWSRFSNIWDQQNHASLASRGGPYSSHIVAILSPINGPWGQSALRRLLYVRNHLLHLFDPGCQLPSHLPLESCRWWMELDQRLINRAIIGEASLTTTMEHAWNMVVNHYYDIFECTKERNWFRLPKRWTTWWNCTTLQMERAQIRNFSISPYTSSLFTTTGCPDLKKTDGCWLRICAVLVSNGRSSKVS